MRVITTFVLLLVVLAATAQEAPVMRNCRPLLEKKGVPSHFRAVRRTPDILNAEEPNTRRTQTENPLIGDRRQLVVMAAFTDQSFVGDETHTLAQWDKILNTEHYLEPPFCGSVHDYFYDQSYGQLHIHFDLYYVALPGDLKKYHSTSSDDENSKYLVSDVVDALINQVEDWSPYDWSQDGYIDQLLIIYSGKGQSDGGGSNTIWPHQWWLSQHENCSPITVKSNGKRYLIDTYCCTQEISSTNEYDTFGVLCHEYSHCFGLPDFYSGSTSYVGDWDIMDRGNYNGDGYCPCGYSSFERTFMGWMTPVELTEETSITDIHALNNQPQAYLVRNNGEPQEYYLIENRQQNGWDADLPGSGIVIAHVDYDEPIFTMGEPNSPTEKHYTIFAANNQPSPVRNRRNIAGWAYPYEDNNRLTDSSEPAATLRHANVNGTLLMSKPITQMTVADGIASFRFKDSSSGIEAVTGHDSSTPSSDKWYSIDGLPLNGRPTTKGLYIFGKMKVAI